MAETDSEKALQKEILEDAERRAGRTRKKAEREAARIRAEAEEQARAERERILAQARERASREERMILAAVPLEASRHKLGLQEDLIRQALAEAAERLEKTPAETYLRMLVDLAASAVSAMPGNTFAVTAATRGDALDAERLGRQIMQAVREQAQREVSVTCETSEEIPSGLVIRSGDGRQVWDNTFVARMQRLKAVLRRELVPLLFDES